MREIAIDIGYKFMLRHPGISYDIMTDKLSPENAFELLLTTIGTSIFYGVQPGESFRLLVIGEKGARSFILKRLEDGDGDYAPKSSGGFDSMETEYSVRLELQPSRRVFCINHYNAGGGNKKTALSGGSDAVHAIKEKFSGFCADIEEGIRKVKGAFSLNKLKEFSE